MFFVRKEGMKQFFFIITCLVFNTYSSEKLCHEDDSRALISLESIQKVVEDLKLICGQRELKLGESCITSKGFEFKLVGIDEFEKKIFEDVATKKRWSDKLDKAYKHKEAIKACENYADKKQIKSIDKSDLKFELPTLDDFVEAESHGFREVLPNSGYTYKQSKFLMFPEKEFHTHDSYWAKDVGSRQKFGLTWHYAGFVKMAKDYFEYSSLDPELSYLPTRCVSK